MNKNSRMLPHLNVAYLQKKAYDVHRKKIDYIRHSLRNSRLHRSDISKDNSLHKLQSQDSPDRMSTIKEQTTQRYQRLNPLMRRKLHQNQIENFRLIKRIECSTSTINRKDIRNHMVRSKELKDRLCKFKYNPYLKKTQLKSVSSLQRLEKIKERDFDEISNYSHQYSNNKSRTQESKSLVSRISKYTSSQNSESKVLSSNKSSFEKLMAQRNISKVKVHFGNEEFASRIKGKLDSLKKGNYSEMKRYRHPEPISSYWKSRCFTTQIESSN